MLSLSTNKVYLELKSHFEKTEKTLVLKELFSTDLQRAKKFSRIIDTDDGEILVDFSMNLVNGDVLKKLIDLVRFFVHIIMQVSSK